MVITGGLSASAIADWTGSVKNVVVRADATADGKLSSKQSTNAVPLNAEIHARYNGKSQEIALNKSYVRLPQTSLEANGTVSTSLGAAGESGVQRSCTNWRRVADMFSPPDQPLGLQGQAAFNGTVRGSTSAPQIAGQLNAKNVQVRGSSFRLLRTNVQASPSQVSLQNGDLELATATRPRDLQRADPALHNWTHTPNSPFAVDLHATQVSVAALTQAANVSTPITGTLNANVVAHGTQLNPIGQGDINLRNASVSGEPVKPAQVKFQGTGDAVHANMLVQVSRRQCDRAGHLLSQAGRLRCACCKPPTFSWRRFETLARAQHGYQRHAEPESERPRHAEQSARHGFAHHPRSSIFRSSRSTTSTSRATSPIMKRPSISASQLMYDAAAGARQDRADRRLLRRRQLSTRRSFRCSRCWRRMRRRRRRSSAARPRFTPRCTGR